MSLAVLGDSGGADSTLQPSACVFTYLLFCVCVSVSSYKDPVSGFRAPPNPVGPHFTLTNCTCGKSAFEVLGGRGTWGNAIQPTPPLGFPNGGRHTVGSQLNTEGLTGELQRQGRILNSNFEQPEQRV